jgi:cytochrome P450
VSATLSALIFLLARHPSKQAKLLAEIDAVAAAGEPLAHSSLLPLPFLDGCIKEALRLYPAIMSGLQRETGPEGAVIAGHYIPANTIVSTPTYTMHRGKRALVNYQCAKVKGRESRKKLTRHPLCPIDPCNFPLPNNFIPERWMAAAPQSPQSQSPSPQQPLIFPHSHSVFNPFSTGPYACAGKNFALMEMRLVVAALVRNFRFRFPEQEGEGEAEEEEMAGPVVQDCFTMRVLPFWLVFERREIRG